MPAPFEGREPRLTASDYVAAAAEALNRLTPHVDDTGGDTTARVANTVAIAHVWATLAVADRLAEIAANVDSLDGAVRDLHETLRGAR